MGMGTCPSNTSILAGPVLDELSFAFSLPFRSLPVELRGGLGCEIGTTTPHSQFRILSFGCFVVLSLTRRPLKDDDQLVRGASHENFANDRSFFSIRNYMAAEVSTSGEADIC